MWNSIKNFFMGSETIAWARLNTAVGLIATAVTYVDPTVLSPVMPTEWFPLLLIANGIATEYLRRRREEDM